MTTSELVCDVTGRFCSRYRESFRTGHLCHLLLIGMFMAAVMRLVLVTAVLLRSSERVLHAEEGRDRLQSRRFVYGLRREREGRPPRTVSTRKPFVGRLLEALKGHLAPRVTM